MLFSVGGLSVIIAWLTVGSQAAKTAMADPVWFS
jgi:hypothetical protein